MKYCEKCGKEILDEAVVCPSCGCSTQTTPASAPASVANDKAENPKTARFALGFAFLFPIVGIIFGIKGIKQYATNKKLKTQCIIAIPLSIVMGIAWISIWFGNGGLF